IHDYIEIWHNTSKRHSALNMLTPIEFENQHTTTTIAARFQTPASKKNQARSTPPSHPARLMDARGGGIGAARAP
ncbi:MAG TPA: IS3 family transposase, partial [Solirubrobacteraceae bacterium]|nr:IS3 family transposase [Solirubrobacteraceae bacterium]